MRARILKGFRESDTLGPVLLAVTIGLIGGAGAIVFRYLIDGMRRLFFDGGGWLSARIQEAVGLPASDYLQGAYVILLPALGIVIVSWIVRRWAPEAQGHGVPEVMYAMKREGGRIRPRVAGIKALASALCIGSGGSVGREGPIVQIGCTFGSTMGRILGLDEGRVKLLVACGAAAGVAGTFNAPIAGVIFALEVILGDFAGRVMGLVVISSVTATALCHSVLGKAPAFALTHLFTLKSPLELPMYVVLGVLAGLVALSFVRVLYAFEDGFHRWRWSPTLKAAIGGLGVGAMGFFFSAHLFGTGYGGIESALGGEMAIWLIAALIPLKILAASLTLAAGGSGGIFAPSLFIGAMLGGAFGLTAAEILPAGMIAPSGAYALVGMAAVFAGAAHAPITSIIILFEMTDDYKIILPLMIATVISYLIAVRFSRDSIYTIKLRRRGGLTPPRAERGVLDLILVTDAMVVDVETVRPDLPVGRLVERFQSGNVRGFPVVDAGGQLVGIVTASDAESTLLEGKADRRTVGDIMTRSLITCAPKQSLREVLRRFPAQDVNMIPVVDPAEPGQLLGLLRRHEIIWAYGEMAYEHQRLMEKTGFDPSVDERDSVQVSLEVRPGHSALCFRKVRDIPFPENCVVVMLHRASQAIIPHGKTVIEPGDVLLLLTNRENAPKLQAWVAGFQ